MNPNRTRKVAKTMSFSLPVLEIIEAEAKDCLPRLDKPFSAYVEMLVIEARRARGLPEIQTYQTVVGRPDGKA